MLLRQIHLQLDGDEFGRKYGSDFGFRTRHVTHFVERKVRALRIKTDGYSGLVVEGASKPKDGCPIVGLNAALAQVAFDRRFGGTI